MKVCFSYTCAHGYVPLQKIPRGVDVTAKTGCTGITEIKNITDKTADQGRNVVKWSSTEVSQAFDGEQKQKYDKRWQTFCLVTIDKKSFTTSHFLPLAGLDCTLLVNYNHKSLILKVIKH